MNNNNNKNNNLYLILSSFQVYPLKTYRLDVPQGNESDPEKVNVWYYWVYLISYFWFLAMNYWLLASCQDLRSYTSSPPDKYTGVRSHTQVDITKTNRFLLISVVILCLDSCHKVEASGVFFGFCSLSETSFGGAVYRMNHKGAFNLGQHARTRTRVHTDTHKTRPTGTLLSTHLNFSSPMWD